MGAVVIATPETKHLVHTLLLHDSPTGGDTEKHRLKSRLIAICHWEVGTVSSRLELSKWAIRPSLRGSIKLSKRTFGFSLLHSRPYWSVWPVRRSLSAITAEFWTNRDHHCASNVERQTELALSQALARNKLSSDTGFSDRSWSQHHHTYCVSLNPNAMHTTHMVQVDLDYCHRRVSRQRMKPTYRPESPGRLRDAITSN